MLDSNYFCGISENPIKHCRNPQLQINSVFPNLKIFNFKTKDSYSPIHKIMGFLEQEDNFFKSPLINEGNANYLTTKQIRVTFGSYFKRNEEKKFKRKVEKSCRCGNINKNPYKESFLFSDENEES